MRSSRTTEVPLKKSAQLFTDPNIGTEWTTAWKTLPQSKAALRHIENRLEATPGTGALLDSVTISPKKKTSRTSRNRDGQQADVSRGTSKPKRENQQSPAKSNSRSPLRNATQDSNVRKNSSVEFREPLASYREATPPSHPFSQLEAYNLQAVPGSSYTSYLPYSEPLSSQLIYQRDTRDLDSTHSSALESAEVRYLNDQPVLDSLRTEQDTHKAQLVMDNRESNSFLARTPGSSRQGESTPSTSPGSVSQRLENLRRHQPDDKLEKLKERIRRQRQHLEENADRETLQGCLEKPIVQFGESDNVGSSSMPAAKIRKVTAAPPAPIYKGFNSTDAKIQTPDGKVWKEEDFSNFSREIYRDLSCQFPESSKSRHQQLRADKSKERRPSKPVRKVHKVAPISEQNSKPVIGPASWREGQKLVKMVLGPPLKPPREEHSSHPAGRPTRTVSRHHSDSHSEQKRHSRPNSTERPYIGFQDQAASRSTTSYNPSSPAQDKMPRGGKTGVLSVDIQGILDDLQLDCKPDKMEERARKRTRGGSGGRRGGSGSRTRAPVSAWGTTSVANRSSTGCRSASPTTHQPDSVDGAGKSHKKRHYDADTVRQYIAQQQEERKRRQAEEKRAVKEEAERRNQRLQELYKKQREVAKTVTLTSEAVVAPVQKRLQETYTKLLLEDSRLDSATPAQRSAPFIQMRPMYQPSGESDKENKRMEVSQSPSSSDKSLNEQPPPPLSRNDLEVTSLLQPDHLNPALHPTDVATSSVQVPSNEHLLSQLLRLEAAIAASNRKYTDHPATAPRPQSQTRMSRIEVLKAKAASLSNRIETEARRFAGQGINYGAATSVDVDIVLPPRNSNLDVDHWTETAAHVAENTDMSFRVQKAFASAGNTSYTGAVLPGAGNLHDFNENCEKPHSGSPGINGATTNSYAQERWRIVGDLEERTEKVVHIQKDKKVENLVYPYQTDLHDSSAGSISEGPLLSEGSLSEEDGSPPHYSSNRGPNSDYLEAVDCSAGKRSSNQRLFDFQREAAKCSALSPPFSQLNGSKAPWEELNKGSPLSVINIFTKNSQGLVKVSERPSERNSPPARSSRSGNEQGEAAVYEDDFVSSHSSRTSSQLQRGSHSPSHSQRISPGSTPGSSPLSRHSTSKKATISDLSDATLVEEQRTSPLSETFSSDHKKRASDRSLSQAQAKSADSETVGELSAHSPLRSKLVSSSASPDLSSSLTADSLSEHGRRGSYYPTTSSRAESRSTGELQYSPAVLQQRMAAELHYLESIEESIKQLGDVEKLMGVSMAQQESASLAQMLKAKQQRHEREIYELKIKTEREALEAKLQLEENRQRVARAHLELQENLAASQKQTLEGIQESTSKMMSQQAEAARHTADAARHIKEMADLARSQITGHLIIPPVAVLDHQEEQHSSYTNPQENSADSKSFKSEISHRRARSGEPSSLQNSLSQSDSLSLRRPNISGSLSGSSQTSPLHAPSDHRERLKREAGERKQRNERAEERRKGEAASSSIEDDIPTAANESLCSESIPSVGDEKGETTSVATEYSLKFDESMTEDEIEERSFRSLLPSEAHRRGTMEKKSHQQKEAEEGGACPDETLVPETGSCSSFKSHDAHIAFSGGQDSFSQFTMEMVRQYMRDEEVRLQHQSSLLHLRQKALKEKTRTELAWLEHQKKKLRDKGEDDKMPPIRKKQRGLLLKLQQEQAEIKRLQEANKAARKERQLLLKQQEEIERMRNSTLRLKERLKCAEGEAPPETLVSEPSGSELSSQRLPDEIRSPSPSLSISGSETSSIMAKLKKMRSHMDEKFLTKREQQLMQRRHHAEELLQWKQQLDQEEAEVRRMEKEALAVWDQRRQDKDHKTSESHRKEISETGSKASHHQCLESRSDSEKDLVSEDNCSSITTESSVHTEGAASQHQLSPSSEPRPASVAETPLASVQSSKATYTQDFSTESQLPAKSSSLRGSHSPSASPLDSSSKTKMQLRSTSQAQSEVFPQVLNAATAMQSENISDQSDIECRIKALREELRKRKIMAYQLKKEQKKRHKERLKAQEANLLKKLENYNNFIEKTKAELNKEPGSTPDTSHRNESNYILEQSSLKHSQQRTDINTSSAFDGTLIDASQDHSSVPQSYQSRTASKATPEDFPNDLAKTPSGIKYSRPESDLLSEPLLRSPTKLESEDDKALSDLRSDIEEELDVEVKSRSEDEVSHHHLLQLDSQEKLIASDHVPPFTDGEHDQSLPLSLDQDEQKKRSKISEAEETPYSAAVNLETSPHTSRRSSHTDRPLSPESVGLSLNKDPLLKDVDPSTGTDGYHKDFESANSSPREEHISRHESQICVPHVDIKHSSKESSKATSASDHEVEEEEIPEEMSQHSGESEESHHSEKLLELQLKEDDLKFDTKTEFSSQAPGSPPVIMDEMPSFHLGDRVLIGGVQPGTLRFKGPTSFANGFWAGVELDKSEGRNNGTYDGVVYFECKESHGIFAPPDKVSHLPDKFELYTDTTEDEDSFFDDLPDKGGKKHKKVKGSSQKQEGPDIKNEQTSDKKTKSRTEKVSDEKDQIPPKTKPYLNSQHQKEPEHQLCNGNIKDIILDFNDASSTFLTPDKHGIEENEETTAVINKIEVDNKQDLIPTDQTREVKTDRREQKEDLLDTFTDKLLNNFIKDSFYQCAEIKRAKEEKIKNANQLNECLFDGNNEEKWLSSLEQKDNLPFFLPAEKEELSSPELCNRSESPVFGPSGQEELAKRLAELELSRELLDDLGDDQDWFDEDFGLSSRRQQQRLKQKEELQGELGRSASSSGPHMGGMVSSLGGESQVKTPPRPELPLPLPPKLPEQPAMVVPHSATEVEKMVQSATLEIWETFDLGKEGSLILEQHPKPTPSLEYLGKESSSQDQKALSVSSYKKAVYDLTWEILKEIFAEDPNTDQPQWVKTRQVKSTSIHRVKTSGDIKKIQEFVAEEVLKLYGLTQDESQKSDWQKMLKFGRKKRDRVDHILVQELHEEEAQWVNYDEDELFVKIQLADSIFEALLKDTASTFTLISDKRSKRGALS